MPEGKTHTVGFLEDCLRYPSCTSAQQCLRTAAGRRTHRYSDGTASRTERGAHTVPLGVVC